MAASRAELYSRYFESINDFWARRRRVGEVALELEVGIEDGDVKAAEEAEGIVPA